MKIKVFYSWQSDKPDRINQNLIQEATQLALERIISDNEFEVQPALDRDTLDIPGSPAIAQSILEKIQNCGLFLCDVTIVTDSISKRAAPNPNVLIELGYAAAKIGWERIICVMNESFGGPTKLPFDLQHRRWPIRYSLPAETTDDFRLQENRDKLSETIEYAIRSVIQSGIISNTVNPKDRRVAEKLENALDRFIGTLAQFLSSHGYKEAMTIINDDHPDESGSRYPDPILVDPILAVLSHNSLKSPSSTMIGDLSLPWSTVFVRNLERTSYECNRILDQYADRDDRLISLIDEIGNRSRGLASIIGTCVGAAELTKLYDNGVPDVHMDFFKYFLLTVLKSYRVLREFK